MTTIRSLLCAAAIAAALLPSPVNAAQSYDSCTGFIDSLPATIGTQGVWCLRGDLSTAISSGPAITIVANNVTIDCNDFKLGGLAAGNATIAIGIHAQNLQNVTVRNCGVRGFMYGIAIFGGGGHEIVGNRIESCRQVGIMAENTRNLSVRRNRVLNTGLHAGRAYVVGISASGMVVDNSVIGVFAADSDGTIYAYGIRLLDAGNVASGNTVRGLHSESEVGSTVVAGIVATGKGARIESNDLGDPTGSVSYGISSNGFPVFCGKNSVGGFTTPLNCIDIGGNSVF